MFVRKIKSLGLRANRRSLFFVLVVFTCFVSFSFWSHCADTPKQDAVHVFRELDKEKGKPDPVGRGDVDGEELRFLNRAAKNYNVGVQEMEMEGGRGLHDIECVINKEFSIQCRREDNEVYMPFSFIQKYFEVYGSLENNDAGDEQFQFSHSYSIVHPSGDSYSPDGPFMDFEFYHVEVRKRVRCITATEGVPMSTQWDANGHFYPIQIAQFGLSHYSKYLRDGEPDVIPLVDGSDRDISDWGADKRGTFKSVYDKERASKVLQFSTPDSPASHGVYTELKESANFALSVDLRFASNGSLSATVLSDDTTFHVFYVFSNTLMLIEGKNIYYGLGERRRGQWFHIARDLNKDLMKALASKRGKAPKFKGMTLLALHLRGNGWVDNMTLASESHMDHFFDAANWFVKHQDSRGGWPIQVPRRLIPEVMELDAGWYSAMGQGHAMSTLVRAYLTTKNRTYLQTAVNGLKVFDISSAQGGVKARFANTYDWYEEYPTIPSSYVLNGFIFSLIGLYDVKEVTSGEAYDTAKRLYDAGMKTLKFMLLMFDNGSGTFYDLRHITAKRSPNRARWDYHTTHINQLLQLSLMDKDPLFPQTAQRWMDYMRGKRAQHN